MEATTIRLWGEKLTDAAMPAALARASRAAGRSSSEDLLRPVRVRNSFDLTAARGAGGVAHTESVRDDAVIALETADGTTLFTSTRRLGEAAVLEDATRAQDADLPAALDLELFDRAAARGIGGLWSRAWVLEIDSTDLLDAATGKAREIARDWIGGALGDALFDGASWVGARALMWAIESRMLRDTGLYRWVRAQNRSDDLQPLSEAELAQDAAQGPLLVFLHGTGSNTSGSFADLRGSGSDWAPLAVRYGARIYGYEHASLSESPLENALDLLRRLPAGAQLDLVSHSRGGLLGDLLCLGGLSETDIGGWKRRPAPEVRADEVEAVTARERELLRALRDELQSKALRIGHYVRVAAPARGTLLASANLDVFLSALLSVIGLVTGLRASGLYNGVARVVLEAVKRRMDPQVVPGIEAMLPESPLAALLARASRNPLVKMAVIAGDIEQGSLWQRLGVLFTDWALFDRLDNDLVVNTDSMFEGLARDAGGAHYLFDQGARVTHFRYFANPRTQRALRDWLLQGSAGAPKDFTPLPPRTALTQRAAEMRATRAAAERIGGQRPVVVVLPGIMGSHLKARGAAQPPASGRRIWMDLLQLRQGGLRRLRYGEAGERVEPDGLFELHYGQLCEHLSATHDVIRFPYDWRLPIQEEAARLAARLQAALDELDGHDRQQPLRLLAHSMGGLVCRAMIAAQADLWQRIARRPGSRLVMLGTPNNGSHLLVQHLLGQAATTRALAALDGEQDLQQVLDVVASFPGALQLMPRPGFIDTGNTGATDYFDAACWQELRKRVRDRWFGDGVAALPAPERLAQARRLWDEVLADAQAPQPAQSLCYVFGVDARTPCAVQPIKDARGRDSLQILTTPFGDGSVTWDSGRLKGLENRCWYLPASHGALADTASAFPAIVELLQTGETQRLSRTPPKTRAAGPSALRRYEPGPPAPPTEAEIAQGLFGQPQAAALQARRQGYALKLSVLAADLRFATRPVVCGHYPGDPISGAEAVLDRHIVSGGLSQRERLGLYAGAIGSSTLVLMPLSDTQKRLGIQRGALVVGLGEFGKLGVTDLSETVRAGVLRLLLHRYEALQEQAAEVVVPEIALAPLLLGNNSTAHIGIDDSMAAIVRGVLLANQQFADGSGRDDLRVGHLEFIELYLDTAISAAHAARRLPERLHGELARLGVELEPAAELHRGPGARARLADAGSTGGYWPRVVVTDADRDSLQQARGDGTASLQSAEPETAVAAAAEPHPAERLRYLFLSQRARAESVVQQRQPRLIESLVLGAVASTVWNESLSRTLFQLLVPPDFKDAVRNGERLLLVVDGFTANLPWEMLATEEGPLIVRARLVRQLASPRYRTNLRAPAGDTAYVIGNPSTRGFFEHFPQLARAPRPADAENGLAPLPGAAREAAAVREALEEAGYRVTLAPEDSEALDVIGRLHQSAYRVVHVAAHGIFRLPDRDGRPRSGVVLSDGLMLTAVEIGQMEVVPELVFLNCCHLGKTDKLPRESHRLAYSLARELIEIGVRCVIVSGWEVDDRAGALFADTLYRRMLFDGASFADALFEARKAAYESDPACNTWGAYQAYGDPLFSFRRFQGDGAGGAAAGAPELICVEELLAELENAATGLKRRLDARSRAALGQAQGSPCADAGETLRRILSRAPQAWLARADVQYRIGGYWADAGESARAIEAYLQSAAAGDPADGTPVRALEQLADLEAREGAKHREERLIRSAIGRLEALQVAAASPHARRSHPQRAALLGSAYKRLAVCLAQRQAGTDAIEAALRSSRAAYATAGIDPAHPAFEPYPAIQHAQIGHLLGAEDAQALSAAVRAAGAAATQAFAHQGEFFDIVAAADAQTTLALIGGQLAASHRVLLAQYRDALASVPSVQRETGSIVDHLEQLAELMQALGHESGEVRALRALAEALRGSAASAAATGPADTKPAAERRPRATSATRKPRHHAPKAAKTPRKKR